MYVSATEISFIFVQSESLKYFDSSSITELNNNNKLVWNDL